MFQHRHYCSIASILRAERESCRDDPRALLAIRNVMLSMADVFAQDNPPKTRIVTGPNGRAKEELVGGFKRNRFYKACGVPEGEGVEVDPPNGIPLFETVGAIVYDAATDTLVQT